MCAQIDAMRELRVAAECLSAACRARVDPMIGSLRAFYDAVTQEPVPEDLERTLGRLGKDTGRH